MSVCLIVSIRQPTDVRLPDVQGATLLCKFNSPKRSRRQTVIMTIIDPRRNSVAPVYKICLRLSNRRSAVLWYAEPVLYVDWVAKSFETPRPRAYHSDAFTQEASSQTITITMFTTDCASFACGCSFASCQILCVASRFTGESGGNSSSNFLFPLLFSFLNTLRPTNSSLQVLTLASFPTNPNGSAKLLVTASSSILSIFVEFRAHCLLRLCPYTALRQTLNATFWMRTTSPALALCSATRKSSFSCLPARAPCDSAGGSQKLTLKPARVSSPTRRSRISMVL
jgi:hypothetical protein